MNIGPIYFLKPQILNWIAAIPLAYILFLAMEKKRKSTLERFVSNKLWQRVIPELDWGLLRRKFQYWCLALFWMLIALARPQYGEKEDIVPTNGFDMILAIDVSNSMLAEDVVPSRLKKTKRFVKNLLERMAGDRVGLVAFAGTSQLLVPLTTDLDYVYQWVENLATDSVGAQGTDLGGAIESAARALDRGAEQNDPDSPVSKASRIVLIISDGEDHESQIQTAVQKVTSENLNVYAFGVGTEQGGPIPIRDADGRNLGYKRDRSGTTVTTKLSSEGLAKLAEAGSGKYWTLSPGEGELDEFVSSVDKLSRSGGTERKVVLREDRFQFPLAFAILFLLLELLTRSRIRVEDKKLSAIEVSSRGAAKTAMLFLVFLSASQSLAGTKSMKAYEENKKGIESAKAGKTDDSRKRFSDALTADPDAAEIVHNQAVLQLQEQKLKESIELFESSSRQAGNAEQYDLQAMSLYDLGVAKTLNKDKEGAADAYIRALESLTKAPNRELEAMTRKNLELLFKKQSGGGQGDDQDQKDKSDQKDDKDQSKSDKKDDKSDGKDSKDKGDKNKSGKESGDSEADQGKDKKDEKNEKNPEKEDKDKQAQAPSPGKKQRNFKSAKLSKDDAEQVLQGLAQAEEKLQDRMKRQKGRPQGLEKDW